MKKRIWARLNWGRVTVPGKHGPAILEVIIGNVQTHCQQNRLSWNCWNQVQATAAIICCKQMFSAESESVEWHPVHGVLVNKKEALTRLYLWQGGDLNTINFVNIFILNYLCCLTITKLKSQFYIGWNPSSISPSPLMCLPSSGGVLDLFSDWWKTITEPCIVSLKRVFSTNLCRPC